MKDFELNQSYFDIPGDLFSDSNNCIPVVFFNCYVQVPLPYSFQSCVGWVTSMVHKHRVIMGSPMSNLCAPQNLFHEVHALRWCVCRAKSSNKEVSQLNISPELIVGQLELFNQIVKWLKGVVGNSYKGDFLSYLLKLSLCKGSITWN